jgi:hypothetical protein
MGWNGPADMRIASTNRLRAGLIHSRQTGRAVTRAGRGVAISGRACQIENPGGAGRRTRAGGKFDRLGNIYSIAQ